MTPERAATLFRELLQTPLSELPNFARRHGLQGHPGANDLEHGRELLQALMIALQSGPGPNWDRIHDAWHTMRTNHGPIDMSAMGVAPPAWVRDVPAKPALGDPAPGTAAQAAQAEQRQRFVPVAKPQHVPQAPAAPAPAAPAPAAPAPAAPAPPYPHPPAASSAPAPGPAAAPLPAVPAPPATPSAPAPAPAQAAPSHAPAPQHPPVAPAAAPAPPALAPSPPAPAVAAAPLPPSEHVRSATYPPAPVAPGPGMPARQLVAPAWDVPADDQPGTRTPPMGEAYAPGSPAAAVSPAAPAQHVSPQPAGVQPSAPPQAAPSQPVAAPLAAPSPHVPAAQPPPPPQRGAPPPPAAPSSHEAQQGLEMSVSTYAAFCAACAAMPERVAETQREYGIASDDQRASIDDLWQDRFDEDPALHQQWEQMFARFRDQLRRRG